MTSVMTDLVEHRSLEQGACCHRLCLAPLCHLPFQTFPRQPVADLRVTGEKQNSSGVAELEGQGEARVVRVGVQLQCQNIGGAKPIELDLPPFFRFGIPSCEERLAIGFTLCHSEPLVEGL